MIAHLLLLNDCVFVYLIDKIVLSLLTFLNGASSGIDVIDKKGYVIWAQKDGSSVGCTIFNIISAF